MNFFPLWTAIVWPTISGTTVERRDQVLMTFFSLMRFIASSFSRSGVSTKGPFFSDLLITCLDAPGRSEDRPLHLFLPTLHDEAVRVLAVPRLVALGRLAPRRHRVTAARGLALAAAERVIHRVHRHAAHVWTLTEPAAPPSLADRNVLVIEVAHLADRGHALDEHLADFARGQLHRRVFAFARHQLHRRAGTARHLTALARPQLHVVDHGAEGNVLQRQAVARQNVHGVAGHDGVADLQSHRMQDVALLTVSVGEQRDPRRAV